MPISTPALATVAIFTFQWAWNDFLYPLVYLGTDKRLWTMALGLNSLRSYETANMTHLQMAFSVLMIIPVITAFAFGQKHLVQGITFTGLKG